MYLTVPYTVSTQSEASLIKEMEWIPKSNVVDSHLKDSARNKLLATIAIQNP